MKVFKVFLGSFFVETKIDQGGDSGDSGGGGGGGGSGGSDDSGGCVGVVGDDDVVVFMLSV
jgi:hypothetical protein